MILYLLTIALILTLITGYIYRDKIKYLYILLYNLFSPIKQGFQLFIDYKKYIYTGLIIILYTLSLIWYVFGETVGPPLIIFSITTIITIILVYLNFNSIKIFIKRHYKKFIAITTGGLIIASGGLYLDSIQKPAIDENWTEHSVDSGGTLDNAVMAIGFDIEEDGDTDIFCAYSRSDDLYFYENDGSESFTKNLIDGSCDGARYIQVVDFDEDGDYDLIVAESTGGNVVLYDNDGSESFTKSTLLSTCAGIRQAHAIDVNDDTHIDIITAETLDDELVWYENQGDDESFTTHVVNSSTDNIVHAVGVDMDNDDDIDILVTSSNDNVIYWYEQTSSEVFGTQHIIDDSTNLNEPNMAEPFDENGDGHMEVVVSTMGNHIVRWYENDGSGSFTGTTIATNVNNSRCCCPEDFDLDGDYDVLVGSADDDAIYIIENNGDDTFTKKTIVDDFVGSYVSTSACVDDDSYPDIVGAANTDDCSWFENPITQSPPSVSQESPSDGASSVSTSPTCSIRVTDSESDTMTVYWYNSTDGSTYTHQQTNTSVSSEDTVTWVYDEASENGQTYYWKVAVNDTNFNKTETYYFTTISLSGSTGWYWCDSYTNDAGLVDPSNVYEDDGNYAQLATNKYCNYYSFDDTEGAGGTLLDIPDGSAIEGIELEIKAQGLKADSVVYVELSWNGGTSWTSTGYSGTADDGTWTVSNLGGSSDTWGRTWSASEFDESNFYVNISTDGSGFGHYVDYITVNITYEQNAAPTLQSFSLEDEGNIGWDLDNNDILADLEVSDAESDDVWVSLTFSKGGTPSDPTNDTNNAKFKLTSAEYTQNNRDIDWTSGTWSDYDGTVTVKAIVYDGSSYSSVLSDTFSNGIDGTAPSITNGQSGDNTWRDTNDGTYDVDFSDATSGLDSIQVRVSGGTYYDITSIDDAASYTTDWSLPTEVWNALSEGQNNIDVRCQDEAGNSWVEETNVFYVKKDTVNPTGSIDAISDGTQPDSITGSSSDETSGVGSVDIQIYDTDDSNYWTGSEWGSQTWLDCTGTTTWSCDSSGISWDSGHSITITLRVYDSAGNVDNNADTESFDSALIFEDTIRTDGIDYFVWLGGNTTMSGVVENMTGYTFDGSDEISHLADTGHFVNYTNADLGGVDDIDIYTFDVIKSNLEDDTGLLTIEMTENSDYTGSYENRTFVLTDVGNGYNLTGFTDGSMDTLSNEADTMSMVNGEFIGVWNQTVYAWEWYVQGFNFNQDVNIGLWDVCQTKITANRTWDQS